MRNVEQIFPVTDIAVVVVVIAKLLHSHIAKINHSLECAAMLRFLVLPEPLASQPSSNSIVYSSTIHTDQPRAKERET